MYRIIMQDLRPGFPKFWTFKNKWLKVIVIYYLHVARNDMSSRSMVKGRRKTRTCWRTTIQMLDVEALKNFFFAIKKFGCNGQWIIVRNTRSRLVGVDYTFMFFSVRVIFLLPNKQWLSKNGREIPWDQRKYGLMA